MTTYERVEKVLDKIRPYIQSDGGNIALVAVDEGVERMIRQEIPEIKEVVAV
jgi:Fe-S cluster biogenesis protein NfuA